MVCYIDGGFITLFIQTVVITTTSILIFFRSSVKKAFSSCKQLFAKKGQ